MLVKTEHFIDLHLILSQGASLVKAHRPQVGSLNCLLGLSTQDIFPFEPYQAEGIHHVEVDWTWRGNAESKDEEEVEKDDDSLKVVIGKSDRHCTKVYQHTDHPVDQQKVYASSEEVGSSWCTMKDFS